LFTSGFYSGQTVTGTLEARIDTGPIRRAVERREVSAFFAVAGSV
jgi:hypothetical protein